MGVNKKNKTDTQKNRQFPLAKKDLGQHFLNDKNVIEKICSNFMQEADAIIEIGPGPGVLTKSLAQKGRPFFVIEKDHSFEELLSAIISRSQIYFEDALDVDLEELIQNNFKDAQKIWLVSNLPYNVSVPLLIKFTKIPRIKFLTLMFQKEVAEKIIPERFNAKNSTGSLNILTENFFDKSLLIKVSPGAFVPPPKVDSTVISFVRKESSLVSYSSFNEFEAFLRKLFAFKRKQLFSVLRSNFPAEKIEVALNRCSIDKKIRAETLTFSEVTDLFFTITGSIEKSGDDD